MRQRLKVLPQLLLSTFGREGSAGAGASKTSRTQASERDSERRSREHGEKGREVCQPQGGVFARMTEACRPNGEDNPYRTLIFTHRPPPHPHPCPGLPRPSPHLTSTSMRFAARPPTTSSCTRRLRSSGKLPGSTTTAPPSPCALRSASAAAVAAAAARPDADRDSNALTRSSQDSRATDADPSFSSRERGSRCHPRGNAFMISAIAAASSSFQPVGTLPGVGHSAAPPAASVGPAERSSKRPPPPPPPPPFATLCSCLLGAAAPAAGTAAAAAAPKAMVEEEEGSEAGRRAVTAGRWRRWSRATATCTISAAAKRRGASRSGCERAWT